MNKHDELPSPSVDRALTIITGIAVVVGVALRFAPRNGLWLDEALTVNISTLPLGDIAGALKRDGHPPLYYVLLHVWTAIGGTSDWWIRALPALIGTLALAPVYFAGRRMAERSGAGPLGGRRTGLIAMALMAILPYGIRYGAESRMYSLVILLVSVGYLLVDDLLAGRRTGRDRVVATIGAALVAGALLWTHYWSMWLLAAVGLVALWRAVKEQDPVRRTSARFLVGALVAGGVLFLPWVPTLLFQSQRTGTPWGTLYGPASVVVITVVDFAGARHGIAHLMTYLLVALVLVAVTVRIRRRSSVVGAAPDSPVDAAPDSSGPGDQALVIEQLMAPRIRNELLVLGLTMGLGWAAATASGNTFASRYAAVVYPLFILCIAGGLAVIRQPRLTAVLLALIVAASTFGGVGEMLWERTQADSAVEEIAADIDEQGVDDAVIVACPDQLGVALERQVDQQLDGSTPVIPFPTLGDPRFVDWVDYGDRNEAADPSAFIARVDEQVGPDTTVYLAFNPNYRTFEDKCEPLVNALATTRDGSQLEAMMPDDHDETLNLFVFRPRA